MGLVMNKQEWQEEFDILPQGCPHCNGDDEDGEEGEAQDEPEQE